jgi:IclR family acetate operon transcriptional repressor
MACLLGEAASFPQAALRKQAGFFKNWTERSTFCKACSMGRKLDTNAAAVRAFGVLDALAAEDGPLSLAAVVARVGLPKPTVHRLLTQLEGAGMVRREPGGKRFSVGPHMVRLAMQVLMNSTSRGARHSILQGLVDELGETCNLTMLDGAEIVYLDRVEAAWPLRVSLQPGSRVPLHCSASGKLLLAMLPPARRTRLVSRLSLTRQTANTITQARLLEQELKRIRKDGCATDNEEFLAGLVCVAVPISGQDGKAMAAVAVQAPMARMPLAKALGHIPRLRDAADHLAGTFA